MVSTKAPKGQSAPLERNTNEERQNVLVDDNEW